MLKKLALGTAQFGLNYGISNEEGRTPHVLVNSIINYARRKGIDTLDTAPLYGDSEQVLGQTGIEAFNVITKTWPLPEGDTWSEDLDFMSVNLQNSLDTLQLKSVHGLLIHHAIDLLRPGGDKVFRWAQSVKSQGLAQKIGVSIYTAQEIDQLLNNYRLDIIQIPINIIDQRLIQSGSLQKMVDRGVEVHCRSAFLQGLLLMELEQIPGYFSPYKKILQRFHNTAKEIGLSALELSLGYLMSLKQIDKIIVGVAKPQQLEQIVQAAATRVEPERMIDLASDEVALVNPGQWS